MAKPTLYAAATVSVVFLLIWVLGSAGPGKFEASAPGASTESAATGRAGSLSEGASATAASHQPTAGAVRASGSNTTQSGARLPVAAGVAPSAADPTSQAGTGPGRAEEGDEALEEESEQDLTPEQVTVLTMYEGMAKTLAGQAGCDDIGVSLNLLVDQHAASVKTWAAAQTAQGAEGAQVEQQILEDAAPRRLKRLREGIRQGLMRCGGDPKVNTAIAKLASLNGGA